MADVTPNPALGVNAKLAIGPAAPTTLPLDFESESLGVVETFLDPQGLRGTRSHAAARVRSSSRLVTGDIFLPSPTAVEWASFLPYFLGGTVAGTSYPLGESLTAFVTDILRGATLFRYTGCRGSRLVVSSRAGGAVSASLSVLGLEETTPGGAFPTLTLDTTTGFFQHADSVAAINIGGVNTYNCFGLTITVDNFVQARQVNSLTATAVYTTDRIVTWELDVPWGDAETLYALAVGGIPVTATFVNGNTSLAFSSPKLQIPRDSPDVRGRDEIHNILRGVARYSAAPNDELTVTLDSTP